MLFEPIVNKQKSAVAYRYLFVLLFQNDPYWFVFRKAASVTLFLGKLNMNEVSCAVSSPLDCVIALLLVILTNWEIKITDLK